MKRLKPTRQGNTRPITISLKVNAEEMRQLLGRAHGLCGGNVSEYLRYAALKFVPRKEDFQK